MIIVLDSNEYINYLNRKTVILDKIVSDDTYIIFINETITKEVTNNLGKLLIKSFYDFLFRNNIIAKDEKLSLSLFQKYKKLGLKKGDIAIAAFCESVSAEYLLSENRHFLKNTKLNTFRVMNLHDFLNRIMKEK